MLSNWQITTILLLTFKKTGLETVISISSSTGWG